MIEQTLSDDAVIEQILLDHREQVGSLLPILHAVQDQIGFIPEAQIPVIAKALHLTRAEVYGVVTFYHYFRTHPVGKHVVHVCRAEACQSMGGVQLEQYIKDKLGVDYHETTNDGLLTIEPVYCLGNCACAPSIQIDQTTHGRMSKQRFDYLCDELND